jgi:hypothetical protein
VDKRRLARVPMSGNAWQRVPIHANACQFVLMRANAWQRVAMHWHSWPTRCHASPMRGPPLSSSVYYNLPRMAMHDHGWLRAGLFPWWSPMNRPRVPTHCPHIPDPIVVRTSVINLIIDSFVIVRRTRQVSSMYNGNQMF